MVINYDMAKTIEGNKPTVHPMLSSDNCIRIDCGLTPNEIFQITLIVSEERVVLAKPVSPYRSAPKTTVICSMISSRPSSEVQYRLAHQSFSIIRRRSTSPAPSSQRNAGRRRYSREVNQQLNIVDKDVKINSFEYGCNCYCILYRLCHLLHVINKSQL